MDVTWKNIGPLANIPRQGARRLCFGHKGRPVAVFRTGDDTVFAIVDQCPHKQGPLSEGIVCGHTVTCPLHNWVIDLKSGVAAAPDEGRVETLPIRLVDGDILVGVPAQATEGEAA